MKRGFLRFGLAACLTVSVWLAVAGVAHAADPSSTTAKLAAKPAAQSLDDQLLQGLDNSLNDKLPAKTEQDSAGGNSRADLEASGPKPSNSKSLVKTISRQFDPLDDALSNSLSAGENIGNAREDAKNPLAHIVVEMRQVQQRLAQSKSDRLTQKEQQRISAELKSLVEQLKRNCQAGQRQDSGQSNSQQASRSTPKQRAGPGGKTPAGNPSNQPARNSTPKLRPNRADRPDPTLERDATIKELDRLQLPEKDREVMRESPVDEFLPGHESSIEEYFKRLMEQEEDK